MTRDPKQIERDAKLAALADRIIEGERKAAFADAVAGVSVTSARYERDYQSRVNALYQILAVEGGLVHPDDTAIYQNRMSAAARIRAASRPEIKRDEAAEERRRQDARAESKTPAGKHALEIETVNSKGEIRKVVIVPGEAEQAVIGASVAKRDRKAAARLAAKARGGAR
jgi:hypothetical protein